LRLRSNIKTNTFSVYVQNCYSNVVAQVCSCTICWWVSGADVLDKYGVQTRMTGQRRENETCQFEVETSTDRKPVSPETELAKCGPIG